MSLQGEQSQEHNLRAGFSMFAGQSANRTNSHDEEKSNDQAPSTKESNNQSPIKNTPTPSSSSSTSNVKPVGSGRFFMSTKK